MKKLFVLVGGLLLLTNSAFGQRDRRDRRSAGLEKTLQLRFYGEEFRGHNRFGLKRLIRQNYPGLTLSNYHLDKVHLVAKSRQGYGEAFLEVGGEGSATKYIDGTPRDFRSQNRETFYRVRFSNPAFRDERGRWVLHIKGNIKVRKIAVSLTKKRGFGRDDGYGRQVRVRTERLREFKADKYATTISKIGVYSQVKHFSIDVSKRDVSVIRAEAFLESGETLRLYALEGFYERGQQKRFKFRAPRGEAVRQLVVEATTPKFKGSRGIVEVSAGKVVR